MSSRCFIGWSRPFLPQVAEKILRDGIEELNSRDASRALPPSLDLGKYVYVLTGRRAMRTLEAHLQARVEAAIRKGIVAPDWTPPSYVAIGELLERLYSPRRRLADATTRLCCEYAALERLDETSRRLALGGEREYDETDASARFELVRPFLRLEDELASERCSYEKALRSVANDPIDGPRWRALAKLGALYREELEKIERTDRNVARNEALDAGRVGGTSFDSYNGQPREYRVVGAVDLNQLQKDFFTVLGDRVQYWIFAPKSESDKFDATFGSVVSGAFASPIESVLPSADPQNPLPAKNFFQVDSPSDQGEAVAALVAELARTNGVAKIDPETLTIGAPDDGPIPYIEQRLNKSGYETIVAQGSPIERNRVYQTLVNIADYVEKRGFESLTDLIRRPEVGLFVKRRWNDGRDDAANNVEVSSDSILRAFDRYRTEFHPTGVLGRWMAPKTENGKTYDRGSTIVRRTAQIIGDLLADFWVEPYGDVDTSADRNADAARRSGIDPERDELAALKVNLKDLDAEAREAIAKGSLKLDARNADGANERPEQTLRTLKEWAPILSQTLCAIYGETGARPGETSGRAAAIDAFFETFNNSLDSLDAAPTSFAPTTGGAAIRVVLKELEGKMLEPAPGREPIEIQGWLDLLFDDAPNLIVTGYNEGVVPGSRSSSEFISDAQRASLGLSGAERVVNRDAYLTAALAHSRTNAHFIFGRRTLQGDPLQPSRFVFGRYSGANGRVDDPIAERVCRFFGNEANGTLAALRERDERRAEAERPDDAPKTLDELNAKSERANLALELADQLAKTRETRGFNRPILNLRAALPDGEDSENYPKEMSVTDFEKFLESPYRYFLAKVYRLSAVEPPTLREMNAATFGNVAHEVLRIFGERAIAEKNPPELKDEHKLRAFLNATLDDVARGYFDRGNVSPFVRIQLEQIRWRLSRFAVWQSQWAAEGWDVKFVERSTKAGGIDFPIDDSDDAIWIKGRIDRIDYNGNTNEWRVFDYKTFDEYKLGSKAVPGLFSENIMNTVDRKHRREKKRNQDSLPRSFLGEYGLNQNDELEPYPFEWTNLQLPLYSLFFEQIIEEYYDGMHDMEGTLKKTKYGYIVLPKSQPVQALGPIWTERDWKAALNTARWVVRKLREFWRGGFVNPLRDVLEEGRPVLRILSSETLPYRDEFDPLARDYQPEETNRRRKEAERAANELKK